MPPVAGHGAPCHGPGVVAPIVADSSVNVDAARVLRVTALPHREAADLWRALEPTLRPGPRIR